MRTKTKILTVLLFLSVVDTVVPFPIIGVILIHVLLQKPPWFLNLVREIYEGA